MVIEAIIFDLGGTLLDFPDWETETAVRWRATYQNLQTRIASRLPREPIFVDAMRAAELEHWHRVDVEHWSGPPSGLVQSGFRRMKQEADEATILAVLDAYARAVDGWARPFPDAIATLDCLRRRDYRVGLLSNTWWAAEWHNADLATHGLAAYLDARVYTSDLAHSKPHPEAFLTVAGRLGVASGACVMVGDRPLDDIGGALSAGMRAVLKTNGGAPVIPAHIAPSAVIGHLAELPAVIEALALRDEGAPV